MDIQPPDSSSSLQGFPQGYFYCAVHQLQGKRLFVACQENRGFRRQANSPGMSISVYIMLSHPCVGSSTAKRQFSAQQVCYTEQQCQNIKAAFNAALLPASRCEPCQAPCLTGTHHACSRQHM